MEIDQVFKNIDESDKKIIDFMAGMISIPAIAPQSGGKGEAERIDYLEPFLKGFDKVHRFDYMDEGGFKRSSLVAIKNGKKPNTIWILTHVDTVPPGNIDDWDTDPFTLVVKDGILYGRGTEDDGGPLASSLLASEQFLSSEFNGYSLGLIFAADEEVGSNYGIVKIIDEGIFKKGDTFLIPDIATKTNDTIFLSEKTVLWVTGKVIGKTAHGSEPLNGLNPIPIAMDIIRDITDLAHKYNQEDRIFPIPTSTFTSTKFGTSPGGTNALPGFATFALDCRLLPVINIHDVTGDIDPIMSKYESKKGVKIEYDYLIGNSGKSSSIDTPTFKALSESIERIVGRKTKCGGSNGATCAAHLRANGYNCYCWTMHTGSEHSPNEHISLHNIKVNAKVMAMMINKLCV